MANKLSSTGLNEFQDQLKAQKTPENVVVYFSASKKEDGTPWCPDCATADPVVESQLDSLSDKLIFLYARIDRPLWKETDPSDNVLKSEHNVKCLPTLMRWAKPERVGEDECKDSETVKKFLSAQHAI